MHILKVVARTQALALLAAGIALISSLPAAGADEKEDSAFRAAVKAGVKVLEASDKGFPIMEEFVAVPEVQLALLKKQIENTQKNAVGQAFFDLAKVAEELEERADARAKETLYWQANYDYVLARLYARQARILEYNVMLGKIRRDDLPQLNPQLHKGWRLVGKDQLSDKDAKECADKARKYYKRLLEEHKDTPWELIAKAEVSTKWGLDWVPLGK